MPSLQRSLRRRRWAQPRQLTVLLLSLASASCDALFGSYATDNQDNCVRNAALCPAPDQTCNPSTKLCEPATILTTVDPPSGSNVGGTLVTLSGTRFIAGMTVSFDGVPATAVTVSGTQQLTAMTPARPGRQGPVVVALTTPAGQHVEQNKLFRYYGEVAFQQQCFPGPFGAATVIAVELNGDGKTDLLISGASAIRPYLSSGDGLTFQAMADIKPGITPQGVTTADLNGDGKIDLIFQMTTATNTIATALGNGDGTFQALVKTTTTQPPYGLAVGDVNGDKRPDALTLQNQDLVVQLGKGDGTFLTEQHTPYADQSSRAASSMALLDLDGDGQLDAATLNPLDAGLSILFGQAGGSWATPLRLAFPAAPFVVLVSDYNQDGILDLAAGLNRTAAKIEFLPGLGGRKFGPSTTLVLKNNFRLQAQGDFNGDQVADLVTLDAGGQTDNLIVFLGVGGTRFIAQPPQTVPAAAVAAAVGDWNGDGRQDFVTISNMGDSTCVLRNLAP